MNETLNENLNEVNQINEQLHNDVVSDQLNKEQDTIFEDAQREIAETVQEDKAEIDEEKLKEAAGASLGSYDYGAQRAKEYAEWAIKNGFEGHYQQAKWKYEDALKKQEEERIKKETEEKMKSFK